MNKANGVFSFMELTGESEADELDDDEEEDNEDEDEVIEDDDDELINAEPFIVSVFVAEMTPMLLLLLLLFNVEDGDDC